MTKIIEIKKCDECPYSDTFTKSEYDTCNHISNVVWKGDESNGRLLNRVKGEIPFWCPLPDKESRNTKDILEPIIEPDPLANGS